MAVTCRLDETNFIAIKQRNWTQVIASLDNPLPNINAYNCITLDTDFSSGHFDFFPENRL